MTEKNAKGELAARIKDVRKSLGMTQANFAGFLGVTQGLVSRWEKSLIEPRPEIIARLAEVAGITPGEFHYGFDPNASSGRSRAQAPDMTGVAGKRLTDAIREAIRRAKAGRNREVAVALTLILEKCETDRERFLAAQREQSAETDEGG